MFKFKIITASMFSIIVSKYPNNEQKKKSSNCGLKKKKQKQLAWPNYNATTAKNLAILILLVQINSVKRLYIAMNVKKKVIMHTLVLFGTQKPLA